MVVRVTQSLDLMLMKRLFTKTREIEAQKKVNMNIDSMAVENMQL